MVHRLLVKAPRARTPSAQLELGRLACGLSPGDLAPEVVELTERTTGKVVGASVDGLCRQFGISRCEVEWRGWGGVGGGGVCGWQDVAAGSTVVVHVHPPPGLGNRRSPRPVASWRA